MAAISAIRRLARTSTVGAPGVKFRMQLVHLRVLLDQKIALRHDPGSSQPFRALLQWVWRSSQESAPEHAYPTRRSQAEQQLRRLAQNAGELQCKHTRDRQEVCVVE